MDMPEKEPYRGLPGGRQKNMSGGIPRRARLEMNRQDEKISCIREKVCIFWVPGMVASFQNDMISKGYDLHAYCILWKRLLTPVSCERVD